MNVPVVNGHIAGLCQEKCQYPRYSPDPLLQMSATKSLVSKGIKKFHSAVKYFPFS